MSNGKCDSCCDKARVAAYAIGIAGTFLIMTVLVRQMYINTQPAGLNQARAEERAKNLKELREVTGTTLHSYAWRDQAKGVVHLPIEDTLKIAAKEWQNPASARTNLIGRADKFYALPPKAPEKPSAFE